MLFHIHKHHTQKNKHTKNYWYIWLGTQKCNANVIPTWKRLHWKLNLAPYNELPVLGELPSKFTTSENLQIWTFWGQKIVLCKEPCKNKSINQQSALEIIICVKMNESSLCFNASSVRFSWKFQWIICNYMYVFCKKQSLISPLVSWWTDKKKLCMMLRSCNVTGYCLFGTFSL